MRPDDYLLTIDTYIEKLNKLLNILAYNPEKYQHKISETIAILKVVSYLREEYIKSVINSLAETTIVPKINYSRTRSR